MPINNWLKDETDPMAKLLYSPPGCFVWLITWLTLLSIGFVIFWRPHVVHWFTSIFFPGMPVIFGSLLLSYPIAIPLIFLLRPLLRLISYAKRSFVRGNSCATCGRHVRPYAGPGPGRWTGTGEQFAEMPRIEAFNAFRCEACGALICPTCAGNMASELGVNMFVCTECGHKPIKTIYRK